MKRKMGIRQNINVQEFSSVIVEKNATAMYMAKR
jgi:hypothetical protein